MSRSANEVTSELLVSDIVANNYRAAEVLKKYDIDFCCGGKISLRMACELRDLDGPDILEELQQVLNAHPNADQWSVNFMIDYLINIHHNYIKKNIPPVNENINKFITSHGKRYPEIQQVLILIEQLSNKLIDQVNYESDRLFPYIKRIVYAHNNNEVYGKHLIKTFHKLSATDLEQFHARTNELISEVVVLTNNFNIQENICITHKVMLQKLQEFIDSIQDYMLIEKKYLIPLTLQMEKNLLEKYI